MPEVQEQHNLGNPKGTEEVLMQIHLRRRHLHPLDGSPTIQYIRSEKKMWIESVKKNISVNIVLSQHGPRRGALYKISIQ